MVVIDSSVPRRVARFQPVWRKCIPMTRRPASTMILIGLSETNTLSYYDHTPLGDTISRCTADVETVSTLFTTAAAGGAVAAGGGQGGTSGATVLMGVVGVGAIGVAMAALRRLLVLVAVGDGVPVV